MAIMEETIVVTTIKQEDKKKEDEDERDDERLLRSNKDIVKNDEVITNLKKKIWYNIQNPEENKKVYRTNSKEKCCNDNWNFLCEVW